MAVGKFFSISSLVILMRILFIASTGVTGD